MVANTKGKRQRVYWDTSVLLAWVKDENRGPGQMENLYGVADRILRNEVLMFTSATAFGEIYESSLTTAQKDKLSATFDRSNTTVVNIDVAVGRLAAEIRQFYSKLSKIDGRPPMCYADAEHLAAAIIYKADEFHTFDRDDKVGKDGISGCRGLLGLGTEVAGYPLRVCMPVADQLGLV